jgi:hypothetical protein
VWPPVVVVPKAHKENSMVLTISDDEFMRMKTAALDGDQQEALRLIKDFLKRLEQQQRQGLKSHLD